MLILRFKRQELFNNKILLMCILVKMQWHFLTLRLNQKSHRWGSAQASGYYEAAYILLPAVLSSSHGYCVLKNGLCIGASYVRALETGKFAGEYWQLDGQGTLIPCSGVHTNTNNTWLWKVLSVGGTHAIRTALPCCSFLHLSEKNLNSARIIKKEAGEIMYVINK